MLTFFRRIRKGLLDGGATSKYLLYAMGEVALVVIGILIALQINNWNEWRKARIEEKKILEELIVNIEQNCLHLTESLNANERRNNSTAIIFDILTKKITYSDTMDIHFFMAGLRAQLGTTTAQYGYEAYKNVGFDKVRNDSLSKSIVYLFEEVYESTNKWA